MNEQIKEIMRQACKQSMRPESVLEDVPQDVLTKFAELIVRGCADISNQAEKQCQHPGTMMKKHFGVE